MYELITPVMSTFDFLQQLYSFSNYMNWVQCHVILVVQVDETFLFVLAVTIFRTFLFFMAQQPLVGQGILIVKGSSSHSVQDINGMCKTVCVKVDEFRNLSYAM